MVFWEVSMYICNKFRAIFNLFGIRGDLRKYLPFSHRLFSHNFVVVTAVAVIIETIYLFGIFNSTRFFFNHK